MLENHLNLGKNGVSRGLAVVAFSGGFEGLRDVSGSKSWRDLRVFASKLRL